MPFESSVVLEGSKTPFFLTPMNLPFESSVVLEGSKTDSRAHFRGHQFESSVVLEGSKTGNGGAAVRLKIALFEEYLHFLKSS